MKKTVKIILWILAIPFSLALLLLGYFSVIYITTKTDVSALNTQTSNIEIYDIEGIRLYSSDNKCVYENLSPFLVDAFTSIEDKTFFSHNGVNFKRLIGATVKNLKSGKITQGASTITQQLAKNAFLSNEKSYKRKIKELKYSFEIENNFTKQEILCKYLDRIYFGNGVYGINSACNYYFNKDTSALTLSESAYLAGLVKAPSVYSKNDVKAHERKNLVLAEMRKDNKIDESQLSSGLEDKLKFSKKKKKPLSNNRYYQIINNAKEILGYTDEDMNRANLRINSYINSTMSDMLLNNSTYSGDNDHITLVLDNTMHGIVHSDSSIKDNLQSFRRQPGSIIKPIIPYSTAFEKNIINLKTKILDAPCSFGGYTPQNYANNYRGNISIEEAIRQSSNIVAVKTLEYATIDSAIQTANNFNLKLSDGDKNLSLALGGLTNGLSPLEIIDAYSTFANGGLYHKSSEIKSIYQNGNSIPLYTHTPNGNQIIRDDTAYLLTDSLIQTAKSGTAKALSSLPFTVAAKTGTVGDNNGNYDAWTVAYTPQYTVLVWIGNRDRSKMSTDITGGNQPCQIVRSILESIGSSGEEFQMPKSVAMYDIDKYEYERTGTIIEALPHLSENEKIRALFSTNNPPHEPKSHSNYTPIFEIKTRAPNIVSLSFSAINKYSYELYRTANGERLKRIYKASDSSATHTFHDIIKPNKVYLYYAIIKCQGLPDRRIELGKVYIASTFDFLTRTG